MSRRSFRIVGAVLFFGGWLVLGLSLIADSMR